MKTTTGLFRQAVRRIAGLKAGLAALALSVMVMAAGCNTLQSIAVQAPARRVFGQGQELDTSGLVVTGQFKKDVQDVTNQASVSGYDKNRPGEQTITVTVRARSGFSQSGVTGTFTVTVVPVESITIVQPPATTAFKQGDDSRWDGLGVGVSFEGDAVPPITVKPGADALTISGYDKDRAGTQAISVDYYGKRAAFEVTVLGLNSIAVASPPRKVEYYTGEELEPDGLVVRGTWSDGSSAQVTITSRNLSGYDITRGERQTVTVTYSGKTATFPVTYIAFEALTVSRLPTKVAYELGEPLDTMGLQVQGTWPGHSLSLVDIARVKITGYDPLRAGEQRVTVTAGGKSDTFPVRVTSPFDGVWAGEWKIGTEPVDGKFTDVFAPITLTLDGTAWTLRTMDTRGESVDLRGVLTPESNTRVQLQCDDRRGVGELTRNSPTNIRLQNGLISSAVFLDRVR